MATLTVKLEETLRLNGQDFSSSSTKSISSITQVLKTIIEVSTTTGTIFSFAAAASGLGTFDQDDVEYVRLTNLDATNFIIIGVEKETSTSSGYWIKLDAGRSFILPTSNASTEHPEFAAHDSAHAVPSFVDIESITADADTAACQLEIFIALNTTT
jgi:hypothetical protein